MEKLLKLRDEMKEDLLHADGSVGDDTKMTYGQGFCCMRSPSTSAQRAARKHADMPI